MHVEQIQMKAQFGERNVMRLIGAQIVDGRPQLTDVIQFDRCASRRHVCELALELNCDCGEEIRYPSVAYLV